MAFQLPINPLVREVWQSNLAEELELIQRCSAEFRFAYIDIDTDPGLGVPKHVGFTISDSFGNHPSFGSQFQHMWQFNFRDINSESGLCSDPNAISIQNLLQFNHMLKGLICTF